MAEAERELLARWLATRTHAGGSLEHHFPIDDSTHGHPTTEALAWGCNSCGVGWPCLAILTAAELGSGPGERVDYPLLTPAQRQLARLAEGEIRGFTPRGTFERALARLTRREEVWLELPTEPGRCAAGGCDDEADGILFKQAPDGSWWAIVSICEDHGRAVERLTESLDDNWRYRP